eukprot:CAMPEP_0185596870 /NCGR_PEP_ID=MMETSP0434-20130131/81004_1 /TAXON_ID=626734 ORGANISM="Favella taraikaensis, Strain Fe Narragansett Bay" /NCGR_SAMPLE_ID=MMETSP0434 /ASSEMBLY_ACC=CAM_ASM_000379 /LENGTH=98 /DNA_ID=CAMNT_0028225435 /DNA_START=970 /DNA_END=1266 /DNA_ORIENTATION=+
MDRLQSSDSFIDFKGAARGQKIVALVDYDIVVPYCCHNQQVSCLGYLADLIIAWELYLLLKEVPIRFEHTNQVEFARVCAREHQISIYSIGGELFEFP